MFGVFLSCGFKLNVLMTWLRVAFEFRILPYWSRDVHLFCHNREKWWKQRRWYHVDIGGHMQMVHVKIRESFLRVKYNCSEEIGMRIWVPWQCIYGCRTRFRCEIRRQESETVRIHVSQSSMWSFTSYAVLGRWVAKQVGWLDVLWKPSDNECYELKLHCW